MLSHVFRHPFYSDPSLSFVYILVSVLTIVLIVPLLFLVQIIVSTTSFKEHSMFLVYV